MCLIEFLVQKSEKVEKMSFLTQIYNYISSSLELEQNEEFFSETETEWQIESQGRENEEEEEIEGKAKSKMKETLDQAARIMPEMSSKSHILSNDQVFLKLSRFLERILT